MISQMDKDNEEFQQWAPKGTKWIVNMCDTFSYEHYPIYCKTKKQLEEAKAKDGRNMQSLFSIIEIKPKKNEKTSNKTK